MVRRTARGDSHTLSNTTDFVWVNEDADIPVSQRIADSNYGGGGSTESWEVLNGASFPRPSPMPVLGQYAFRTQNSLGNNPPGEHQIYFPNATTTMTINHGDTLFAYVYLDPANPPHELLLQWRDPNDATESGWGHRAYWGINALIWGTDGTNSRRRIGDSIPPTGKWVRLEIPAKLVGLEGRTVAGFAFSLYGGRGAFDKLGKRSTEIIWVDESADIPVNERQGDSNYGGDGAVEVWEVLDSNASPLPNPRPISGQYAFRTKNTLRGDNPQVEHQIYFSNATTQLRVNGGDKLFVYVYLDPVNPPEELMLQWRDANDPNENGWGHRAYWGSNDLIWGTPNTISKRWMGSLPPLGQWARLEIPASLLGLEGRMVAGFAFSLYKGRGAFDRIGKISNDIVWIDDSIPTAQQTFPVGNWNSFNMPNASPVSGTAAFQTDALAGEHILYFENAPSLLSINTNDTLFAYVYIDPNNPPSQLMLQWKNGTDQSNWRHRAYWGENKIRYGDENTGASRYMGPMPPAGQWIRLEVPASRVGLPAGTSINGFSLALYDGRAAFDRVGKVINEQIDY